MIVLIFLKAIPMVRSGLFLPLIFVVSFMAHAEEYPIQHLSGMLSIPLSNCSEKIAGKDIAEVFSPEQIKKAIVLENKTSAPDSLHIWRLFRAIRTGATIQSLWQQRKDGARERAPHISDEFYFSVIFETNNGEHFGFRLSTNQVRVSSLNGCGVFMW